MLAELTLSLTQISLLHKLAALAQPVTDWMLTYALHSTLLLAAAWVLGRALGERRLALQEAVWKIALVGGVVTASLQIGLALDPLGLEPLSGNLALTDGPAVGVPAAVESAASSPTEGGVSLLSGVSLWPMAAAAVWLALAFAGLAGLALAYLRLYRCLADRRTVTGGALPALFGRLLARAGLRPAAEPGDGASGNAGRAGVRGVRLTASPRLPVPIAWGVARREVSLPVEVVEDLSPYHQESILAHEISHLRRHDPAWLVLSRGIETLLFFQPLNRVARRRLQAIAEYRCDDEAVALTGRPLELARCLTEVAAWRLTGSAGMLVPGLVPGMATPGEDGGAPARQGSALARRVRRILDGGRRRAEPLPRAVLPLAAALLLTIALVAPGVTGQEPAPEAPEAPSAPEAPEVAEAAEAPEGAETPETEGVWSPPRTALPAPEAAPAPSVPHLDGVPRAQAAPRPAGPLPRAPRLDRTAPTPPTHPRLHGLPAPAPPTADGPTLPRTPAAPHAADQRRRAEETARRAMERAALEAERVRQRAMEGREAMAEAQAEAERALAEERARLEAEMEGRTAELEQRAVEMARLAQERERLVEERHRATREQRQQAVEARARAHRETTARQRARLEAEIAEETRRIEVESRHVAEENARIAAAAAELRNLDGELGELDEELGELREEIAAEEGEPETAP